MWKITDPKTGPCAPINCPIGVGISAGIASLGNWIPTSYQDRGAPRRMLSSALRMGRMATGGRRSQDLFPAGELASTLHPCASRPICHGCGQCRVNNTFLNLHLNLNLHPTSTPRQDGRGGKESLDRNSAVSAAKGFQRHTLTHTHTYTLHSVYTLHTYVISPNSAYTYTTYTYN
jgi:hypothetical protein